jgi:predicted small integral membrane protein
MLLLRVVKIALVASIALFASLVAFGNVTDYDTNFEFVRHVLMMDTTFPHSGVRYRAISSPALHHAAYIAIIITEATIGILCWLGAAALLRKLKSPSVEFNAAKSLSYAGLGLGLLLWQTGFIIIGGEWFSMWQSSTWNGVPAAFRFAVLIGMTLLIVALPETDAVHPLRSDDTPQP